MYSVLSSFDYHRTCHVKKLKCLLYISDNNPVSNRYGPSSTVPMSNGPIGQSSPYLGRRTLDHREDQQLYNYNNNRHFNY